MLEAVANPVRWAVLTELTGGSRCVCDLQERVPVAALADAGLDAEVVKVTDYAEIAAYGVMATPGLVVDDKVLVSGRVPKPGGSGTSRAATT